MRPRLKWNRKAFEEVRRSPGVQAEVESMAATVAADCGRQYTTSSIQGLTRFRTIVIPDTYRAYRDNQKNNTMVKALSARKIS